MARFKHGIMCDTEGCENTATMNYQDGSVKWTINRLGNYIFDEMMVQDGENIHACDEHDPY